jgi:Leucine-rich repeat (LRR) protein
LECVVKESFQVVEGVVLLMRVADFLSSLYLWHVIL